MKTTETVTFNVGGQRYEVSRSFLSLHPNTLIAKAASKEWQTDPTQEIFIDRDGRLFMYVLSYLRDGEVALPQAVRKVSLMKELLYFGVEDVKENAIDDDNKQTKAGYNVCFIRESAVLYRVVSDCIEQFLALTAPTKLFSFSMSHYDDISTKFAAVTQNRGIEVVKQLLNEHFEEVGLQVKSITGVNPVRGFSSHPQLNMEVIDYE